MPIYSTILFLHIAAVLGLFIGYGLEWIISALLRRATTVAQVQSWLRVYRVSPPLSGASLAVLLLTGGYLASQIGAMKQTWMMASLVALLIAFSMGFIINLPRTHAIRDSLASLSGTLPPDVIARLHNGVLPTSIRVRGMLTLAIVYLMTAKPPLNISFLALGIAVALGLFFSIRTWSRPTPTTK